MEHHLHRGKDMAKSNLARKYRPKLLSDLIGQTVTQRVLSNALEDGKLHQCYLFVGQFGCGKCVTGETMVVTPDGIYQIKDIVGDVDGFQDKRNRVFNGIVGDYLDGSHVFSKKSASTVYIATNEGYSIEGTPEHPVLVYDEETLKPQWKTLDQIAIGDYLCISRNPVAFGESVSDDVILILAALTAEGHSNENGNFIFTNKDEKMLSRFKEAMQREFDFSCKETIDKRTGCVSLYLSHSVSQRLIDLGLSPELSASKTVPSTILRADIKSRQKYLSYYWEFDGCVIEKNSLSFTTKSEHMAKELQLLLLTTFGAISSIRPTIKSATNGKNIHRLYYDIVVYPNEFQKIQQGLVGREIAGLKIASILGWEINGFNPNLDVVPHLKQKFVELKSQLPIAKNGKLMLSGMGVAKVAAPMNCVPSNSSQASWTKVQEIIDYCQEILYTVRNSGEVFPEYKWFNQLQEFLECCQTTQQSNWFFSRVTDVRHIPIEKQVYDLHIPRYHSFWSNGITSHNTSAARILAASENCQVSPGLNPCGKCDICKSIFAGTHTDIEEIDAASSAGSVEHVRKLKNSALYNPIDGCNTKYFIIDECHRMSPQANDALLKLLEEPPKNVRFVLCTTDVQKMRPAIQSRCQRHDIKKIYWSQIAEHLKYIAKNEKVQIDDEAVNLCARLAQGSMRNGIQNLEKLIDYAKGNEISAEDAEAVFGSVSELAFYDLFDQIVKGEKESPDTSQGFKIINEVLQGGVEFDVLYQGLTDHLRNLLVVLTAKDAFQFISVSSAAKDRLKAQALKIKQGGKHKAIFKSQHSLNQAKESVNLNVPIEAALQTWFVESVIFFREK